MQVRAGADERELVHKKDVKFVAWAYCSFKIQGKIQSKIKLNVNTAGSGSSSVLCPGVIGCFGSSYWHPRPGDLTVVDQATACVQVAFYWTHWSPPFSQRHLEKCVWWVCGRGRQCVSVQDRQVCWPRSGVGLSARFECNRCSLWDTVCQKINAPAPREPEFLSFVSQQLSTVMGGFTVVQ